MKEGHEAQARLFLRGSAFARPVFAEATACMGVMSSHPRHSWLLFSLVFALACACVFGASDGNVKQFTATNSRGGRWYGALSRHSNETVAWTGIEYVFLAKFILLVQI